MITLGQRQTMRLAHEAQRAFMPHARPEDIPTKTALIAIGQHIWPHAHKQHRCDGDAIAAFMDYAYKKGVEGDEGHLFLATQLQLPQNQFGFTAASLWVDQGLPQVVLAGHKYAAALLATKLSKDVLDDVRPPWPAFFIEIPRGLLHVFDGEGKNRVQITGVLVGYLEGRPGMERKWGFFALTDSTVTLWKFGMTAEKFLLGDVPGDFEGEPFLLPIQGLDERCAAMLGRLILNVCVAMTDPDNVKPPKEPKKGKKGKHSERGSKEPTVRTYILGKTPTFDCRPQVETYLQTGREGSKLNVQSMTAGHWKRQPYGPGRELRKTIWIEPYWRGPEDAPILAKPRALGKETT